MARICLLVWVVARASVASSPAVIGDLDGRPRAPISAGAPVYASVAQQAGLL